MPLEHEMQIHSSFQSQKCLFGLKNVISTGENLKLRNAWGQLTRNFMLRICLALLLGSSLLHYSDSMMSPWTLVELAKPVFDT